MIHIFTERKVDIYIEREIKEQPLIDRIRFGALDGGGGGGGSPRHLSFSIKSQCRMPLSLVYTHVIYQN